jgi:hypothetical protein
LRVERRDFLLLRAGQLAVLSCEQLFMRFLDSQIDDRTAELFAHLADDLRAVTSVQLVDTSWRARADFNQQLDVVLAMFTSAGGKVTLA